MLKRKAFDWTRTGIFFYTKCRSPQRWLTQKTADWRLRSSFQLLWLRKRERNDINQYVLKKRELQKDKEVVMKWGNEDKRETDGGDSCNDRKMKKIVEKEWGRKREEKKKGERRKRLGGTCTCAAVLLSCIILRAACLLQPPRRLISSLSERRSCWDRHPTQLRR